MIEVRRWVITLKCRSLPAPIVEDSSDMIDEIQGFWDADWSDSRAMCKFVAERLEHYAKRFRAHAEGER